MCTAVDRLCMWSPTHSAVAPSHQALHAECEAVRTLGSSMDQTNQALVDGMCDMSGELSFMPVSFWCAKIAGWLGSGRSGLVYFVCAFAVLLSP